MSLLLLPLPAGERVGVRGGCSRYRSSSSFQRRLESSGVAARCSRYRDLARLRRASVRLPAAGSLLFVWSRLSRSDGEQRSWPEGRRAWMPGVKRSNQEKDHPSCALYGLRLRVREVWPGPLLDDIGTRRPCRVEKEPPSMAVPLRALSSSPHRSTGAPKDQKQSLAHRKAIMSCGSKEQIHAGARCVQEIVSRTGCAPTVDLAML